jgi:hypothetical protein
VGFPKAGILIHGLPYTDKEPMPFVAMSSLLSPGTTPAQGDTLPGTIHHIILTGPQGDECVPGQAAEFTWNVMVADPMASAKDLVPLLGADMHVAVVKEGLGLAMHTHGEAVAMASSTPGMAGMPAPSSSSSSSSSSSGGGDSHAGHGRRMLQQGAAMGNSSGPSNLTLVFNATMGPTNLTMATMNTTSTNASMDHSTMDHSGMDHNGSSSSNRTFGPLVRATITLPEAGVYALIGQLMRDNQLLLAPFYVNCTGKAGGNGTSNATSSRAGDGSSLSGSAATGVGGTTSRSSNAAATFARGTGAAGGALLAGLATVAMLLA